MQMMNRLQLPVSHALHDNDSSTKAITHIHSSTKHKSMIPV
jgi:hypothetical protein